MRRLINTWATAFAIITMMMAIEGVLLNDTASELHDKTFLIGADETSTTENDPNLEN